MKRIELYRIHIEGTLWNFTNSEVDEVYDSGTGEELYKSITIERSEVEQKKEITKAAVTIKIPVDSEFSKYILTSYFEQLVSMTIFKKEDASVSVFWKGRLASYQPSNTNLSLMFESIFTSLRRPGLRATFQRNCRYALYGKGCNLDPEDFFLNGTLSAINGNVLTVAEADAQPDGYYTGGMLRCSDGTLAFITNHVGAFITVQRVGLSILSEFTETGPSTPIKIYPGCDHSRVTCNSKFSNVLNYGGFDFIPNRNPMTESIT